MKWHGQISGNFFLNMRKINDFFSSFIFIMLLILPLVSGCGFQPLQSRDYLDQQNVDLTSLIVTVDSTRSGQLLEAEIRDAINPTYERHEKLYELTISITQTEVRLFINPDGTSGRSDIPLTSNYQLRRLSDSKVVAKGTITRVSSYDKTQTADYASYVSIQDAKKRAVLELAQNYKLRLANELAKLRAGS